VQLACWFDPVVADNMLDRPVICGWHSLCNHQIYKELFYDPYHCYALVFCLPDSPRKARTEAVRLRRVPRMPCKHLQILWKPRISVYVKVCLLQSHQDDSSVLLFYAVYTRPPILDVLFEFPVVSENMFDTCTSLLLRICDGHTFYNDQTALLHHKQVFYVPYRCYILSSASPPQR